MFTAKELEDLHNNPEAYRAVAESHLMQSSMGEAMGYDCSFHNERAAKLNAFADALDHWFDEGAEDSKPVLDDDRELTGVERIARERQRQIDEEKWTVAHDDQHVNGELAGAASVYCTVTQQNVMRILENLGNHGWPWDRDWFKPFGDSNGRSFPVVDRIRCLEKAGALAASEIDRLQRMRSQTER